MEALRLKKNTNCLLTNKQLRYLLERSDLAQEDYKFKNVIDFCLIVAHNMLEEDYKYVVNQAVLLTRQGQDILYQGLITLYYYHSEKIEKFIALIDDKEEFLLILNGYIDQERNKQQYNKNDSFLYSFWPHIESNMEKCLLEKIITNSPITNKAFKI